MTLRVVTPTEVVVDAEVVKVIAEAADGAFCLLPRRLDTVALLVPGLLLYQDPEGDESLLAVDGGVLIKCGPRVWVACGEAVAADDLDAVRDTVRRRFRVRSERERRAAAALAKLEVDIMRRLGELGGDRV